MGMEVIAVRNRIGSEIDQRLRELSWLHVPAHPTRFSRGRESALGRRMTWLGPDLLFDPRTGCIQAL